MQYYHCYFDPSKKNRDHRSCAPMPVERSKRLFIAQRREVFVTWWVVMRVCNGMMTEDYYVDISEDGWRS